MSKKKVGHDFKTPENLVETRDVGGYKFAFSNEGLFICGTRTFNLSKAPIMPCTVMPIGKARIDVLASKAEAKETDFGRVFEYDADKVYYLVSYGFNDDESSGTFVFDNLDTALEMQGVMVHYKAEAILKED